MNLREALLPQHHALQRRKIYHQHTQQGLHCSVHSWKPANDPSPMATLSKQEHPTTRKQLASFCRHGSTQFFFPITMLFKRRRPVATTTLTEWKHHIPVVKDLSSLKPDKSKTGMDLAFPQNDATEITSVFSGKEKVKESFTKRYNDRACTSTASCRHGASLARKRHTYLKASAPMWIVRRRGMSSHEETSQHALSNTTMPKKRRFIEEPSSTRRRGRSRSNSVFL